MFKLPVRSLFKFPQSFYFVATFLTILLIAVYFIYVIHNQLKISAKQKYIGLASMSLIASDQSIDELINSFNISKINFQNLSTGEENDQSANYNKLIEENKKSLSQIDSIKKNLDFQKSQILGAQTPEDYESLKSAFDKYYSQSAQLLASIKSNFEFENNILKTFDSNENFKDITQGSLWVNHSEEELISHYENINKTANGALLELNNLKIEDDYENYFNLQKSYLESLIVASTKVINKLQDDSQIIDETITSKFELAFKEAVESQNKLNELNKAIIDEREKFYSIENNAKDFAQFAEKQETIENEIKSLYQQLFIESGRKLNLGI